MGVTYSKPRSGQITLVLLVNKQIYTDRTFHVKPKIYTDRTFLSRSNFSWAEPNVNDLSSLFQLICIKFGT